MDKFAVGLGIVEFDKIETHRWYHGLHVFDKKNFNILWEPPAGTAENFNKFRTVKVSFKWSLPYVTVYWESYGEESNMHDHDDMDAQIKFIYDD